MEICFKQDGGNPQPNLNPGDIRFIKENVSDGGKIEYSTDQTNWTEVANNEIVNSGTIGNASKIYVRYTLKDDGYKLDDYEENGISGNNVREGDVTTSLIFDENRIAYFNYDNAKTYQVQIRFMTKGGGEETEIGNLSTDVTLNFWEYKEGRYVKLSPKYALEGIKINNFGMSFDDGEDSKTVEKGGYALEDAVHKNEITFFDAVGAKTNAAYLVRVNGESVSKIQDTDFIEGKGPNEESSWSLSVEPATSYDIAIEPGQSDDLTIIWTTNWNTAANWNPDGSFNDAMYVKNGRVEVVSIQRGNEIIYEEGMESNPGYDPKKTGIDISDDFGYLALKRGDDIVLKLIREILLADEHQVGYFASLHLNFPNL